MSEPVKPALTPEEWKNILDIPHLPSPFDNERQDTMWRFSNFVRYQIGFEHYHAVGALALYGQPFGFTRDDVVLLRETASEIRSGGVLQDNDLGDPEHADKLGRLADRIEALLPPEKE